MWSSFTKDEKKLFIFLLVLLCLGAVVLPYIDGRRKVDIFTARGSEETNAAKPERRGRPTASRGSDAPGRASNLLDLNTATESQLVGLPGIGPVRAAAIVAYRNQHGPFQSLEDLAKVHGVGKATLRSLEGFVTVGVSQQETSSTASQDHANKTIGFTPSPPSTPLTNPSGPGSGTLPPMPSAAVLDLNAATVEQLSELEQIGPILAQRIVEYRNKNGRFTNIEQLDKVPGIGKKRIELNRHRLIVR